MEKHHEEEAIQRLIECTGWLAECPFTDGQPFYEVAQKEIEYLQQAVIDELVAFGDEDILNAAKSLANGDDPIWSELEDDELWLGIWEQWETKKAQRAKA